MWLVMKNRMININNVGSIDIGQGKLRDNREEHGVYLRFVDLADPAPSESDIELFWGSMEECQKFMRELKRDLRENYFVYLDNIKNAVQDDENIR